MGYLANKESELQNHIIAPYGPTDFDEFWNRALQEEREKPLIVERKPAKVPYQNMRVYDVTYTTIDDTVIHAYLTTPVNVTEPLPCVVHFHGGNRYRTVQWEYPAVNMCCLSIDVRGQNGDSPDLAHYSTSTMWNHAIASGFLDKEEYYLRNVYLDGVRAVRVAMDFDEVDENRIGIKGFSQGGGMALAVAALCPHIRAVASLMPSYTCIRERLENEPAILMNLKKHVYYHPEHLDMVWNNVAYFDSLNFAGKIKIKTLIGCSLEDPICYPRFVYSAYAALNCEKEIFYTPFSGHEITRAMQDKRLQFFIDNL